MTDNAISVRDLTKTFGAFTAVDRVNFTVRKGEIFGFLGANGAGKSTTIRMMCGLLEPTSGTAVVAGHDVGREPERVKERIGYMSQRFSLYEDLTVRENIRFFGGVYGLSNHRMRERMAWVLQMAGLQGREDSLTRELSSGWRQRLALGCAILHEPEILFLDEPTGGVDPVSRRGFWELIQTLAHGGTTVLVTTHFLDEAEYCHTLTLIHAGRIIAGGSPAQLKAEHIRNPILEVECDRVVDAMTLLQGSEEVLDTSVFGTLLHVGVEEEASGARRIREILEAHGLPVMRITRIVPSLEDVFLHLIEEQSRETGEVRREKR
jgi:ABC-2 type transport system ATP-binding protein